LGARDLFRDGLIRSRGSLESSGGFLGNNRQLRAAGENKAGHNDQDQIGKGIRFHKMLLGQSERRSGITG